MEHHNVWLYNTRPSSVSSSELPFSRCQICQIASKPKNSPIRKSLEALGGLTRHLTGIKKNSSWENPWFSLDYFQKTNPLMFGIGLKEILLITRKVLTKIPYSPSSSLIFHYVSPYSIPLLKNLSREDT